MLTLLPLPTFKESTQVLTDQDLRDSLISVINILSHNKEYARLRYAEGVEMEDDPGAAMWRGYEGALILYGWACLSEMQKRDRSEHGILQKNLEKWGHPNLDKLPLWFFVDMKEKEKIMLSHKHYLALRSVEYYDKFFDLPVIKDVKVHFPRYNPPVSDPIFSSP